MLLETSEARCTGGGLFSFAVMPILASALALSLPWSCCFPFVAPVSGQRCGLRKGRFAFFLLMSFPLRTTFSGSGEVEGPRSLDLLVSRRVCVCDLAEVVEGTAVVVSVLLLLLDGGC